ncbi:MAG: NlpC/P60 family protein [Desulfobulbaceae bacterium]|nr:NlpC/P60 family protein [Desulfobulbaceae bacterium]
MMKYVFPSILLFMVLALTLSGCAPLWDSPRPAAIPLAASGINLSDTRMVKSILYSHYNEWKSAKYRKGGMSIQGIDCSGFVHLTYRSKFGIDLPRSTDLQVKLGKKVVRSSLQAGDLVFFKTGFFQKHVGIFLENQKFMHVSTRNGVMISSLDEHYWSRKYWMAKRVYL